MICCFMIFFQFSFSVYKKDWKENPLHCIHCIPPFCWDMPTFSLLFMRLQNVSFVGFVLFSLRLLSSKYSLRPFLFMAPLRKTYMYSNYTHLSFLLSICLYVSDHVGLGTQTGIKRFRNKLADMFSHLWYLFLIYSKTCL